MQNTYEIPELTVVGKAEEIVLGNTMGGDDLPNELAFDFLFEQD